MRTNNAFLCWRPLLLGVAGLLLMAAPVLAADNSLSVSLGFEYASGDYGTGQTTDSYRIPLTIDYLPNEKFDFELVIPYLHQNNGGTVSLGGMRVPMGNASSGGGSGGGSGMGGMGGGSSTTTNSGAQSGLGDITLTTGYALIAETADFPLLRPLVYLKLPTADKSKGLGTGAFDFGGGLSLAKNLGAWSTYAEALYIVTGSTGSFAPDNYWSYQASAAYSLSNQLSCAVALSGATAPFTGADNPLEAQFKVNYLTTPQQSVGGYLVKGLSNGSADCGVGVYAAFNF